MTLKELIDFGHRELIAFDSAQLDAELLLSHVMGKPVTYLLAHGEVEAGRFQAWRYRRVIAKRKKGMPVAYLCGNREFYGLNFKVSRDVLVPRPDTEALTEAVIQFLSGDRGPGREGWLLLDVGTGSGCIPVTVLRHVKGVRAVATDVSGAALRIAIANARKHDVEKRIQFFRSDLLSAVPPKVFEGSQLIVTANLPYVPLGFDVNIETKFEPQIALWGGKDGMDLYRKLLEQLLPFRPAAMLFECFDFQKAVLAAQAQDYHLRYIRNQPGGAGVMILQRN